MVALEEKSGRKCSPVARTWLRDEEFDIILAHTGESKSGMVSRMRAMEDAPIRPMRYRKLGSGRDRPGGKQKKFNVAGAASGNGARSCFISVHE